MRTLTAASDTVTRSPTRVVPALDHDAERIDLEELRHVAEHAARQQLERGIRRLIGIADRLALLHLVEQARDARIVLRDTSMPMRSSSARMFERPGLVRDEHPAPVADRLRRHMLIGARVLLHGRDMEAAFMREGRLADIRRVPVGRAVQDLVEQARGVGQRPQLLRRDAGLEAIGIIGLQHQRRDDRGEIGVAAALAEPVQRALDLARAGAHRRERVRHGVVGVVMRMDAETVAGDAP